VNTSCLLSCELGVMHPERGGTAQVLLPSFTRAANDAFPPARMAALMSLAVTME
jgi:hypothetical protein